MAPSAPLRDRVESFFTSTNAEGTRTVLPRAGAVLGFQLSGRIHAGDTPLSTAGITGIQQQARTYGYQDRTVSVMVRFTAQGAACLGVPADELASRSVPLDALFPRARVQQLQEHLVTAPTAAAQVHVLEAFLGTLPFLRDPVVERAAQALGRSDMDDAGVAQVARRLGISERQLERRFKARVGLAPRAFARLRRFERAVELARTLPTLTEAALAAGYCDQPHFNREFRRMAGGPPRDVLATQR